MRPDVERAKEAVAREALKILMSGDYRLVGVGTGSTVEKLVNFLAGEAELVGKRLFVPSSLDTALKLKRIGASVIHPHVVSKIDVYFDGADEVDGEGNMIKGGGAALTTEKVLSYASSYNVFLVDYTKLSRRLGEKRPIPVEVLPHAISVVSEKLSRLGLEHKIRESTGGKYGPVTTDIGGVVIDVIAPPGIGLEELESLLESIPGVVATGLFLGYADELLVGYPDRVERVKVRRARGLGLR